MSSLLQHAHRAQRAVELFDNEILSVNNITTGRKRRLGFGKRGKNSFTVQRSEEVVPGEMRGGMGGVSRASSASSENDEDRCAIQRGAPRSHHIDTIVPLHRAVDHSRISLSVT